MYVCILYECKVPTEIRRGISFSGIGVLDYYESPSGYREQNPGPIEVLLTTEASLQFQISFILTKIIYTIMFEILFQKYDIGKITSFNLSNKTDQPT